MSIGEGDKRFEMQADKNHQIEAVSVSLSVSVQQQKQRKKKDDDDLVQVESTRKSLSSSLDIEGFNINCSLNLIKNFGRNKEEMYSRHNQPSFCFGFMWIWSSSQFNSLVSKNFASTCIIPFQALYSLYSTIL